MNTENIVILKNMEGTIQKTKTGYVVYGLNRMNMRGYHGKCECLKPKL